MAGIQKGFEHCTKCGSTTVHKYGCDFKVVDEKPCAILGNSHRKICTICDKRTPMSEDEWEKMLEDTKAKTKLPFL